MKDANGYHIGIATTERHPKDLTSIAISVDSFQDAAFCGNTGTAKKNYMLTNRNNLSKSIQLLVIRHPVIIILNSLLQFTSKYNREDVKVT